MGKNFKRSIIGMALLCLFVLQPSTMQATPIAQATTAQASAKVAQFLKQSGYEYRQAGENVWVLKLSSNALKNYEALVATNEGIVVIAVVMANRKDMKSSEALLFKLLKINHEKDFMKIGFDNDDDLFVRTEQKIRNLDLEEFKALVEQVMVTTDLVFTEIKPVLIK
ncbi:MAG: YbjN domain-containing protein [Acidobacteria bacterium]|nr:YbjN domain-containing protein [Acidobacteriota bacterium]